MSAVASVLDKSVSFDDFGLDPRLLKAIKKMGIEHPSLIQSKCIPLALEGKDVLARARTGSGKTLAYAVPVLQRILAEKDALPRAEKRPPVRALVLVPTRELAEQARGVLELLAAPCHGLVRVVNLAGDLPAAAARAALAEGPDVVVSTPGYLAKTLGGVDLSSARVVVLDEADLLLSYGYEDDLKAAAQRLPRACQGLLMSATLSADIERLKRLVLHSPAVLKLEEPEAERALLSEHAMSLEQRDKFLVLYALLTLKLVRGKALIFVNSIARCFRLKLFLARFGINAAVLNSDLPFNCRYHAVQEFNRGAFQYLIATDAGEEEGDDEENEDDDEEEEADAEAEADADEVPEGDVDAEDLEQELAEAEAEMNGIKAEKEKEKKPSDKKAKKTAKGKKASSDDESEEEEDDDDDASDDAPEDVEEDEKEEDAEMEEPEAEEEVEEAKPRKSRRKAEYSISRGVDFKEVSAVINFDLPRTAKAYVHRVGRTGRGVTSGTSITFVSPAESVVQRFHEIEAVRKEAGRVITPFDVSIQMLEGLRYRVNDVMRGITHSQVRKARLLALKEEIANSKRLKEHFSENPREMSILKGQLQHDKELLRRSDLAHLRAVPTELVPQELLERTPVAPLPKRVDAEVRKRQQQRELAKKRKLELTTASVSAQKKAKREKRSKLTPQEREFRHKRNLRRKRLKSLAREKRTNAFRGNKAPAPAAPSQ